MGAEVRDRRLLEHDLRHAMSRGELRLVYQPQKHLTTGEVVGFEALLRWHHADARRHLARACSFRSPRRAALILQIGEWVLRTACREAASWSAR